MRRSLKYIFCCLFLFFVAISQAEISPEEHASHHPGGATQDQASPNTGQTGGQGSGQKGGMMGGMGEMMSGMMGPKTKEFYPSLMDVPKLTSDQAAAIEEKAHERMKEGAALMSDGMDQLAELAKGDDFKKMEAATQIIRDGLQRFESGLSSHRAVREGRSPEQVALTWFKTELNLERRTLSREEPGHLPSGITLFHIFVMIVLVCFALAMIALYFFKMRKAMALLSEVAVASSASPSNAPIPSPQITTSESRSTSIPTPGGVRFPVSEQLR